jgi:hypothetical protein
MSNNMGGMAKTIHELRAELALANERVEAKQRAYEQCAEQLAEAKRRTAPKTLDELEAVNLRSIVTDQDEDIARLTAENERLRIALRPFRTGGSLWASHGEWDSRAAVDSALTKEEPK